MKNYALLLSLALLSTGLVGCIEDDSVPYRTSRDNRLFDANDRSRENAERRALEAPRPTTPVDNSRSGEFPGQSALPVPGVITACDTSALAALCAPESGRLRTLTNYFLSEHALVIAKNPEWGRPLAMVNYPGRDWTMPKVIIPATGTPHNPVYFTDLDADGETNRCSWLNVPWFFASVAKWPVEMLRQCPHASVTTQHTTYNAIYQGHLPHLDAVQPSPQPGELKFAYPQSTTRPAMEMR
ncbi:MAG: hypothetical protein WCJ97_05985 [Phycisphaerae bacterium]